MANNTIMNNNASVNVAMTKEDKDMMNMTVKALRGMAKAAGVKGYSNMNKADLIAAIEAAEKKVETVEVGDLAITKDTAPVIEETKEESAMEKKAWKDMTLTEQKADALLAKWDKLVKAAAKEYTFQSLYKEYANEAAGKDMGEVWKLFYSNTKSTVTKDDYCVLQSRLFAATGRAIELTYGSKHNTEEHIRQLLNVMIFRGYLNYTRIDGKNGKKNTIVSAMQKQFDDMFALTK